MRNTREIANIPGVGADRWLTYISSLRPDYNRQAPADRLYFFRDYGRFKDLVEELPAGERIPLLILAYERYREFAQWKDFDVDRHFWISAYHILIGRLMTARLKPTAAEACVLLGVACPLSGHGCSPGQPVEIALRAFRNGPYAADLFESARAYREALEPLRAAEVRQARNALDLLLWHDVHRPARRCWTGRIQKALANMPVDEATAWQWLLRNASPSLWNSGVGKAWTEEAKRRLAAVGENRFLECVDQWFSFSGGQRVQLSAPGSHILRLLILYAGLADAARALPILARVSAVEWSQREPMKKVVDGLTRMLETRQSAV